MARQRITSVRRLAGLTVKEVKIYHGDAEEPPSITIDFIGGVHFCFEAHAESFIKAHALLAYEDKGSLTDEVRQTWITRSEHYHTYVDGYEKERERQKP